MTVPKSGWFKTGCRFQGRGFQERFTYPIYLSDIYFVLCHLQAAAAAVFVMFHMTLVTLKILHNNY